MGGECVSIIAAYKGYQAYIRSYSQRTPSFFEYDKE